MIKDKGEKQQQQSAPGLLLGYLILKRQPSSSKHRGGENSPEMSCGLKLQHDVCSEVTSEVPGSLLLPWHSFEQIT